jgi:hypothetical protein
MLNEKKVIVRIAEGLGNQLFMYANALAIAKSNNATLYVDDESAFFKKKNKQRLREYNLNIFNTYISICKSHNKFNTYPKDIVRKFLKIIDLFRSEKLFLIDNTSNHSLFYDKLTNLNFKNTLYIEGHFESEKYFSFLESDLKSSLTINNELIKIDNKLINSIKNSNSISIHIRRHRFSEEMNKNHRENNVKSEEFTRSIIKYVYRSVNFFKNNVENPKFFIWSNDFSDLDIHFDKKNFTFIKGNDIATDFYLFSLCKHFIVGPSTFHWWGAWLNNNANKICLRPDEEFLNPSNNKSFWPKNWLKF